MKIVAVVINCTLQTGLFSAHLIVHETSVREYAFI